MRGLCTCFGWMHGARRRWPQVPNRPLRTPSLRIRSLLVRPFIPFFTPFHRLFLTACNGLRVSGIARDYPLLCAVFPAGKRLSTLRRVGRRTLLKMDHYDRRALRIEFRFARRCIAFIVKDIL